MTFISQMDVNVRPKVGQERAGYARITTTFDIYGHAHPRRDQGAASFLEDILPKSN